jgi:uncharacterized protein YecE (DUF72 family)
MTRFWIGTSGWHYNHWRERFYPRDLPKHGWFTYYARVFDTVELNNSFYRQPKSETWREWRDAAPPGFRFAVKANRFLTHIKRFKDIEDSLKRFMEGAEGLGSFLGPILYQAPPNFRRTDDNLTRLDAFFRLLPARHQHVFEFRHSSWSVDETLELLRRYNVALCVQDMPNLEVPHVATADFVYVRLHGKEKTYTSNYSDAALDVWADELKRMTRGGAKEAWVYFNNDLEGYAIENARGLGDRLGVKLAA